MICFVICISLAIIFTSCGQDKVENSDENNDADNILNDDTADDDDSASDDDNTDDDDDDDSTEQSEYTLGYYDEYRWENWLSLDEHLPFFAENNYTLFLAMPDFSLGNKDLLYILNKAKSLGVDLRSWLLLSETDGYWACEDNAEKVSQVALNYAIWFLENDLPIEWFCIDMELNRNTLNDVLAMLDSGRIIQALQILFAGLDSTRFQETTEIYQNMVDDLEELGFKTMVVTFPQVLDDMLDGDTFIQDLLGWPVSTVNWHEVSTMVYTTTFENYIAMPFGPYLVYDYGKSTVELFGDKASIAIGVTRDMENPEQLRNEIAAAKGAGVKNIQVFAYHEIADMPNPKEWHEALEAEPMIPPVEPSTFILRKTIQFLDGLF